MTAPHRLTDFRKTALIAAIAISLSLVWHFIAEVLTGPHRSSIELIVVTTLSLFILVLELPTPVFLLLLYRTGIRPSPSRNLQVIIGALIAVRSASLLVFVRGEWHSGIVPGVSHLALPAKTSSWFMLSPGSHLWVASYVTSDVLTLVSRVLALLFLVAFARQPALPLVPVPDEARQVKKAAAVAIVASALMTVFTVVSYMVLANAVRTYGKAGSTASTLPMLRNLLFELPTLILPWIIYRSIRNFQPPIHTDRGSST